MCSSLKERQSMLLLFWVQSGHHRHQIIMIQIMIRWKLKLDGQPLVVLLFLLSSSSTTSTSPTTGTTSNNNNNNNNNSNNNNNIDHRRESKRIRGPKYKYSNQLQKLNGMDFKDDELNIQALELITVTVTLIFIFAAI
jgi:hypothetical protein